jgi:ADP-heptose:LPS heptosyltransferase
LIKTLNPFREIKTVNINNCKDLLASEDKKVIISNHPGEVKKNEAFLPLMVSNYAKNYEFVDLYYRSSIFIKYKGENYSKAMFQIILRFFGCKFPYKPNQLATSLKRKLSNNTSDIVQMDIEYPFLSKEEYIVLIEGTSMNAKKFSKWEQLIKELNKIIKCRYQIIRISNTKVRLKKTDSVNVHYLHCDLKYYPYIFSNKNCRLVVSTDTGLAQLSAMLGTDTFILYSISDPAFWNNGSRAYHSIIGKKNRKHIKKIQNDFIRLDPADIRGEGLFTKEGFGASLTTVKEVIDCLRPKICC